MAMSKTPNESWFKTWEVKCTSRKTMERLTCLLYATRCIIAHGRPDKTIDETLPQKDFEEGEFQLCGLKKKRDETGVRKTCEALNCILKKCRELRDRPDTSFRLSYDDFYNFFNISVAFVRCFFKIADYCVDQEKARSAIEAVALPAVNLFDD
jgi:hypothetical protein